MTLPVGSVVHFPSLARRLYRTDDGASSVPGGRGSSRARAPLHPALSDPIARRVAPVILCAALASRTGRPEHPFAILRETLEHD